MGSWNRLIPVLVLRDGNQLARPSLTERQHLCPSGLACGALCEGCHRRNIWLGYLLKDPGWTRKSERVGPWRWGPGRSIVAALWGPRAWAADVRGSGPRPRHG